MIKIHTLFLPIFPLTLGRFAQRGLSLSISSSIKRFVAMAKFLAQIMPKINALKPNQAVSFASFDATIIEENKKGKAKIECLNTTSSKISLNFIQNVFIFLL